MTSKLQQPTKYLPQLIEDTRKARINAETRLLKQNRFVKNINVYYACFTTTLAIFSVTIQNNIFPYLSLCSSVILTIWSIHALSRNYENRASEMKRTYIELQKLWFDLDCSRMKSETVYNKCVEKSLYKYNEIMSISENHTKEDYENNEYYENDSKSCWQQIPSFFKKVFKKEIIIYALAILGPPLFLFILWLFIK